MFVVIWRETVDLHLFSYAKKSRKNGTFDSVFYLLFLSFFYVQFCRDRDAIQENETKKKFSLSVITLHLKQDQKDQIHLVQRCEQVMKSKNRFSFSFFCNPRKDKNF